MRNGKCNRATIFAVGKNTLTTSGWAGQTLSTSLDERKYSFFLFYTETTSNYTPLLASAACGLYDFSLVETSIRRTNKSIKYIKAVVEQIDFGSKRCYCTPAFDDDVGPKEFVLDYDVIAIAPGRTNQTFGTPGVEENALFLKNVTDAREVAARVRDCFEKASMPGTSEQQQLDLLQFIIVGGGPTGVELSSELSDL